MPNGIFRRASIGGAMNILAVVPARGGSKGLPGKNIKPLAGKPMIAWTIDAARQSVVPFSDIVVSTDDLDIKQVSEAAGASVPFMRPAELAGDDASSLSVMKHAVSEMESLRSISYDWVVLLQPTSPLRSAGDIDAVMDLMQADEGRNDSVISVVERPGEHPRLAKYEDGGLLKPFIGDELEGVRRQDCVPPVVFNNGAIYATRRAVLMEMDAILGVRAMAYLMPKERSVDVDDMVDFALAETLIAQSGRA